MKLLDTILVPTVIDSAGDHAVRTALSLAKLFDSKIVLLHVVPETAYPWLAENPGIADLERRLRERHLQKYVDGVHEVEVVVDKGSAAAEICENAAARSVDLIVLGARSSTIDSPAPLGATAERVMRKASTPVWVVHEGTQALPLRVLCPVDGSESSRRALRNAHHLSRKLRARLTVLNVMEPLPTLYSGIVMLGDGVGSGFLTPQKLQYERFLESLDFRDSTWDTKTRRGKPHEQILAEVDESNIDLLVMGTVGKSSIARFLVGSVTEKVARQFPCSMLTMKAQEMIRLRLEADLESLDELLCRGKELLQDGFAKEALREFDRCLVINPTLAAAWEGKALAYGQLGDRSGKEQSLENARRIRERLLRVFPGGKG